MFSDLKPRGNCCSEVFFSCVWGFQLFRTLRQMEGDCVILFSMYFESLSAFLHEVVSSDGILMTTAGLLKD